MAFDQGLWHSPAKHGDTAGVALNASVALSAIRSALTKLAAASGTDLSVELQRISEAEQALFKQFQELTGWTPES